MAVAVEEQEGSSGHRQLLKIPVRVAWTTWRRDLGDLGIQVPRLRQQNELLKDPHVLVCTSCCGKKLKTSTPVHPKELYLSKRVQHFCSWAERRGLRYAILSDLHGLVLDSDFITPYEADPDDMKPGDFFRVGRIVREQMRRLKKKAFLFYTLGPKFGVPYFKIMSLTPCRIYFILRLPALNQGFGLVEDTEEEPST